jgi:putative membrane protein
MTGPGEKPQKPGVPVVPFVEAAPLPARAKRAAPDGILPDGTPVSENPSERVRPEVFRLDAVEIIPVVEAPIEPPPPMPPVRRSLAARLVGWGIGTGVVVLVGLAGNALVEKALSAPPAIAALLLAPLALLGLGLAGVIIGELVALARLGQVSALRAEADAALVAADLASAAPVMRALHRLYGGRRDLEWALSRVATHGEHASDGAALISLFDSEVMARLDKAAADLILVSAGRSAMVTALSPFAAIDLLATAAINLRLVGQLSRLYGGRGGWFATLRLMRQVVFALLVTGGLDASDGILGNVFGHTVLRGLSRRAGEGMVNGLLTVRLGVATQRTVRPLPAIVARPLSVSGLARRLADRVMKTGSEPEAAGNDEMDGKGK